MKILLSFIAINLLLSISCYSQSDDPLTDCKRNFNISWEKIHKLRDSVENANKQLVKYDSLSKVNDIEIKQLKLINSNQENQIQLFKDREAKVEIPPLISWDGFYLCGISYYTFDPGNISNQFIKTLRWAISGEFNFKILDKLKLVLEPMIPIGDKFRIQAKAGWRLF
jgi:hypothetical protein